MLKKLLIANRGEIACRIIRTAQRLGVTTVLAVSEADRRSLAASQADEVVLIGPAPASDSYLRADRVIEAARRTGCDAIHPGYGFLSENADFAEAVGTAGLIFVGPTPAAMRALGSKAAAKAVAIKFGVAVVPGYQGEAQEPGTLRREAGKIGYPLMIKAVNGGGGRGMRLVEHDADFAESLDSAKREAKGAFGSDRVLIEKLVVAPRHIEVQVFGDAHGNVVHLFERDCSLQRRNQKVIEEAPAPDMSAGLRAKMTDAAVRLAKAVGYRNAGTVEFLIEGGQLSPDAPHFFIEMNTRLQVEHPVTEEITGLDLVEWQLRVASGEPLPLRQDQITMSGHAIEARLNAEDPANGFLPSVGRIVVFEPPAALADVRIETGVAAGSEVSPFYDSMIAKLIAHDPHRAAALSRLVELIESTQIAGPRTNGAFLRNLLRNDDVQRAALDTGLIARELDGLTARANRGHAVTVGMTHLSEWRRKDCELNAVDGHASPWQQSDGFQLGGVRVLTVPLLVDGEAVVAKVGWGTKGQWMSFPEQASAEHRKPQSIACYRDGDRALVVADLVQTEIAWPTYDATTDDTTSVSTIRAPINGRVAKLFVAPGAAVEKGARIAVIEAMKMEHILAAPRAGTIAKVAVAEGAQVVQGALIVEMEPDAS